MTSKADYDFKVSCRVLVIYDLNLGNMSVTNDIENVLAEIFENEIDRGDVKKIIYQDSDGYFDEALHDGEKFTGFAPIREKVLHKALGKVLDLHKTEAA